MHTAHADVHDAGLQDNCSECLAHAEKLVTLDQEMLSQLVERTIRMRMGEPVKFPRTETEAIARASVMNTLETMGRFMEVMQKTGQLPLLVHYFQNYWRIELQ